MKQRVYNSVVYQARLKQAKLNKQLFELSFWVAALLLLATSNPEVNHFTLCFFNNIGIENCFGCGLGRSIGYLFQLEFAKSVTMHPLGIPVLLAILFQMKKLITKIL